MNMPKVTLIYGTILVTIGVIAYLVTGMESWTALIPAIFGVLFQVVGLAAMIKSEKIRMHAMHTAAVLALLVIVGTIRGVFQTVSLFGGEEIERPVAAIVQALTSLLSVVFLGFCVQSFVAARMKRKAGE